MLEKLRHICADFVYRYNSMETVKNAKVHLNIFDVRNQKPNFYIYSFINGSLIFLIEIYILFLCSLANIFCKTVLLN